MNWIKFTAPRDLRYKLSKVIPMRMKSTYTVTHRGKSWQERATWIQWRNKAYRTKVIEITPGGVEQLVSSDVS